MIRETVHALIACVATFVLCAVVYPLAVWGAAWLAFPHQAGGSLIERDGKVIGSALVAQPFASEKYFQPRQSAVDYNAGATGGSNMGTKNPDLRKKIAERAEALKATMANPAPTDLVTASGGGLDPEISVEAAHYQVARVAAARKLPVERVRALVDEHTSHSGAIIGAPPRINVLQLNLALDREPPSSTADAVSSPAEAGPQPATAAPEHETTPSTNRGAAVQNDLNDVRSQVDALAQRLDVALKRVDALPPPAPPAGMKVQALEARVAAFDAEITRVSSIRGRVDELDTRVQHADESLSALRKDVSSLHDALQPLLERDKMTKAPDLGPALDLFGKGRFAQAADAFRTLAAGRPDDARAWYLAAVANGLATRQWNGETETLVKKGVECERAGSPSSAEVDTALAPLTKVTGRDWVAFFREQAKP